MPATVSVTEQMEQWACEQQDVRQRRENMSRVRPEEYTERREREARY